MHILIGLLTAVAGLIWALFRLQNAGVDLNSFNPFFWARRRRWERQLGTHPIHRIESPLEAAALLVVAAARGDGEVTREQKAEVLRLFQEEFKSTEQAAQEHWAASSYLLKDLVDIAEQVGQILAPTLDRYEPRQKESLLRMVRKVSECEGSPTQAQRSLLAALEKTLGMDPGPSANW